MHNRRTYRYETHLHTYPVSKCAHKGVREALLFYKELDYDGVFITNHFIDGNINMDRSSPYEALINFYFSGTTRSAKSSSASSSTKAVTVISAPVSVSVQTIVLFASSSYDT